jgi:hypothetical protein
MVRGRAAASGLVGAIALLAAACSSGGTGGSSTSAGSASIPAVTSAVVTTSAPANPNTHASALFFEGGFTATYGPEWTIHEDSPTEYAIERNGSEYRLIFWKDVHPTVAKHNIDPVQGVSQTTKGLLTWLRANPNLVVTPVAQSTIGSSIPATAVDVSVSPTAINDDPQCPEKPCANFLGYPGWDGPYGMAGKSVTRFLLADVVRDDGSKHVLVFAIEARSKADLQARLSVAEPVIATVQLPVKAA